MRRAGDNLKTLGAGGEAAVCGYLAAHGCHVIERNFRCPAGEIDVIAEDNTVDGPVLAFIEVKSRRGAAHGTPVEAVNAAKRKRIAEAAGWYLSRRNAGGDEPSCRFDVAEVYIDRDGLARVRMIQGAFSAGE